MKFFCCGTCKYYNNDNHRCDYIPVCENANCYTSKDKEKIWRTQCLNYRVDDFDDFDNCEVARRKHAFLVDILRAYCNYLGLRYSTTFSHNHTKDKWSTIVYIEKTHEDPRCTNETLLRTVILWRSVVSIEMALNTIRDDLFTERAIDIFNAVQLSLFNPDPKPTNPPISKVIFNPPATIVFWKDGSKTVVKCQDGDVFDPEKGLAMAFMKKAYGNAGKYCDEVKKWVEPWRKEWCEKILAKHDFARTNVLSAEQLREALERAKIELATEGTMSIEEAVEYIKNREKQAIEELFPGILSKAESLAKTTILTTEDAIRRLVNERLKDVEPSLREYYLGQLEPALAKLKELEEKENKEMKRTLTRITTVEITEVIDLDKEAVVSDKSTDVIAANMKRRFGVDDVVVLKVQDFVCENARK